MAGKIEVRRATVGDLEVIARFMRVEDEKEVVSAGHRSATEAVIQSAEISDFTNSILFNGELALVYGVASTEARPDNLRVGIPWLLGTRVISKYPKLFLEASRKYLPEMFANYDLLVNFVDARYDASIRWLKRIGFWVGEPEPFGEDGELFRPFVMKKEDLLCVKQSLSA